jgi:hypothetical protein
MNVPTANTRGLSTIRRRMAVESMAMTNEARIKIRQYARATCGTMALVDLATMHSSKYSQRPHVHLATRPVGCIISYPCSALNFQSDKKKR